MPVVKCFEKNLLAVALSGDITQRARQDQFIEAKSFCESLAEFKILAVPGNNDLPLFNVVARTLRPYYHYKNTFGFPLNSNIQLGSVGLLCLNTTHPKRHVQRELYKKEISCLNNFSTNSKMRIVIFHHPIDCAKVEDEKNLLISAVENLPYLKNVRVDILFSCHIHDPITRLSSVRYAQTRRPLDAAVAGTCLSSRTRSGAANSFNFLEINDNEVITNTITQNNVVDLKIARFDLNTEGQFYPSSHVQFRREGNNSWRPH